MVGVGSAVPQGSDLGPTLSLIYVNAVNYVDLNSKIVIDFIWIKIPHLITLNVWCFHILNMGTFFYLGRKMLQRAQNKEHKIALDRHYNTGVLHKDVTFASWEMRTRI